MKTSWTSSGAVADYGRIDCLKPINAGLKSWWTSLWTIRLMNIIGFIESRKGKRQSILWVLCGLAWRWRYRALQISLLGSAWKYDEASGQYFLHLFESKTTWFKLGKMKKVRHEVYLTWWISGLTRALAGFRMDVVVVGKIPLRKGYFKRTKITILQEIGKGRPSEIKTYWRLKHRGDTEIAKLYSNLKSVMNYRWSSNLNIHS